MIIINILYYLKEQHHVLEMSDDETVKIVYDFDDEKLLEYDVPVELDAVKDQIITAIGTHKTYAMEAPYEKQDIYKQLTLINGAPAWLKKSDIQDWMIEPRKEVEEDGGKTVVMGEEQVIE